MRKIGVVVAALTLPSTSLIQHVHSHVVDSDRRMVDTMDDDNDTHYLRRNTPTRYPLHIIEDNNARWSTGSSLIHEEEANTIAVNIPQSQVSHDNNGVTEDQIHKIQNKERRQKQTNARRENPYQSTEKWCKLFPTSIDIHCYHLYAFCICQFLISLLMHSFFTIPYLLRDGLLSWQ